MTSRREIAAAVLQRANALLARYGAGLQVAEVSFGDIHPPLEVVSGRSTRPRAMPALWRQTPAAKRNA